jgi:hypothetical protein
MILQIENDVQAERMIVEVKAAEAEMNRLCGVCDMQIEFYQNQKLLYQQQYEDGTDYERKLLGEYCRLQATKTTKTMTKHTLPSGTLKWLKRAPGVVKNDDELLDWLRTHAKAYVKSEVVEKPAWGELKKTLIENGDHYEYATEDGEIIPVAGVALESRDDEFVIE